MHFIPQLADTSDLVPPPSSDEAAWWEGPGTRDSQFPDAQINQWLEYPNGAISMAELRNLKPGATNPFDSTNDSPALSSSSTSDEELYTDALTLQTPMSPVQAAAARKPPPPIPPPRRKPTD